MKTFGQQLRERRKALGLTQKAVAERIGATPAYISLLESGKSLPPPRPLVEALAHALDLNPDKLWKAAFEERKQRFLQKAHGRITTSHVAARPEEGKISIPVELEDLPAKLKDLVATLQESAEFREACLHLYAIYQAGGEPWDLLKPLLAHHAREASSSSDSDAGSLAEAD